MNILRASCNHWTHAMARTPSARNSSVDLLRAGAMLYIVGFWHLDDYSPALNFYNTITLLLTTCVLGLFVFLSGMLVSRHYSIACVTDARRFYLRRMIRIYPMYVLTLLGFLATGITTTGQALKGLVGLNMFVGTAPPTLWFVEMLCFFYLIAPLLLFAYTARRTLLMGVTLSAALGIACRLTQGAVDLRLAQYVLIFAIGIIAGRSERATHGLTGPLPVVCCVFALPLIWTGSTHATGGAAVVVSQAAITAFLPLAFLCARWAAKWLKPSLLRRIAYPSFAVYLIHRLTGGLVCFLYRPTSVLPSLLYLCCLWLPLTYICACAFQRGYDRVCNAIMPHKSAP